MKIQVKANEFTIIEVQGETVKDVFAELARAEEVFGICKCGLCGGRVAHSVRQVDQYTYYEVRCVMPECRARMNFGQTKELKGLFPQRKDKDGNWKANGGWEKWQAGQSDKQAAPPQKGDAYENAY